MPAVETAPEGLPATKSAYADWGSASIGVSADGQAVAPNQGSPRRRTLWPAALRRGFNRQSTPREIDPQWLAARRILAIRLDNLGDVLVTTPALRAIKESLPEATLTLLASPVGAQVGRLCPDVDDVIVYDAPWMDPWGRLPQDPAREQRMIAEIAARQFDAAIIFGSYHQSSLPAAYLCYLAGIPLRAAASIDGPGSLLTTRHKHPERMMHEVERGLDLVGALGFTTANADLGLRVPADAREHVARLLASYRQLGSWQYDTDAMTSKPMAGPLVVVHPGCSMPARTYPWELYAEVVAGLVTRMGATVVVTGDTNERALVAQVIARASERLSADEQARVIPMAGELDFPQLCAVIEAADLTITNNTGPMHIAAALKTPVIALFALTNPPEQWGPWEVPHRLLNHDVACRICYSRVCPYGHECLTLVTPDMVVDAARELLAEVAASSVVALRNADVDGTIATRHAERMEATL